VFVLDAVALIALAGVVTRLMISESSGSTVTPETAEDI
jgi:hypothetical protein